MTTKQRLELNLITLATIATDAFNGGNPIQLKMRDLSEAIKALDSHKPKKKRKRSGWFQLGIAWPTLYYMTPSGKQYFFNNTGEGKWERSCDDNPMATPKLTPQKAKLKFPEAFKVKLPK